MVQNGTFSVEVKPDSSSYTFFWGSALKTCYCSCIAKKQSNEVSGGGYKIMKCWSLAVDHKMAKSVKLESPFTAEALNVNKKEIVIIIIIIQILMNSIRQGSLVKP